MSELLLDSLEIKGYRCFEHLTIEKLGRVNLIVGKNNVGKTALLEALWLYLNEGRVSVLTKLLQNREQLVETRKFEEVGENIWDIKHLFYGRKDIRDNGHQITVGQINEASKTLKVEIGWYQYEEELIINKVISFNPNENLTPRIISKFGSVSIEDIPLERVFDRGPRLSSNRLQYPSYFIAATGLEKYGAASLWDKSVLRGKENDVLNALNLIAVDVNKLNFVSLDGNVTRTAVIQVRGEEIVSLKSMGDGTNRLLGIALALVNCKDGMLLIDEIESGLHYSVLPDVWRLIFKTARELNVQVFATTHSYDCVRAFEKVSVDDKETEGTIIRLVNRDNKIRAAVLDEEDLEVASEQLIEVR